MDPHPDRAHSPPNAHTDRAHPALHKHARRRADLGYRFVVRTVLWIIAGAVYLGLAIWWIATTTR